ncbi:uncharacterized protein LOC131011400 isoform X2 [Salvia miltiorrhiza]|uniref:uncharacterized protein LOC131011400 isoform X2 n=1 Tax=Salvia miltiorrhiza TaxID=226208 RepID=UPI0025AD23B9|nr:uncharacterized protein LOC131011400 isoform X2 [Salvia miltiorrhiza]
MLGLNRLNSADRLAALFVAAAATYLIRTVRSRNTCTRKRLPPELVTMTTYAHGGVCDVVSNTYKRKTLPAELSMNVPILTCESAANGGVCDVYLVGTTHFCPESCRRVRDVIRFLKPQNNGKITEFQVAYEEAMEYGAKIILGDRPYEITCKRIRVMAFLWDIIRCFLGTFPTDEDALKTMGEKNDQMDKMFPTLMETLLHERDRYMSTNLLEVASKHNSVVIVVGEAHLQGIQKNWKQHVDMKELLHVPRFGGFVGEVLLSFIFHCLYY